VCVVTTVTMVMLFITLFWPNGFIFATVYCFKFPRHTFRAVYTSNLRIDVTVFRLMTCCDFTGTEKVLIIFIIIRCVSDDVNILIKHFVYRACTVIPLLHESRSEHSPLIPLTDLRVLWEKQPRKLEEPGSNSGSNKSKRNVIGTLKDLIAFFHIKSRPNVIVAFFKICQSSWTTDLQSVRDMKTSSLRDRLGSVASPPSNAVLSKRETLSYRDRKPLLPEHKQSYKNSLTDCTNCELRIIVQSILRDSKQYLLFMELTLYFRVFSLALIITCDLDCGLEC